jgi:hypothetical protein
MIDPMLPLALVACLALVLLLGFNGCLITDRVEFDPVGIFTLSFPQNAVGTAEITWGVEDTGRTHSQQFLLTGAVVDPDIEFRTVTVDPEPRLREGTWSVSCDFTLESQDTETVVCPGIEVSEGDSVRVEFHVTGEFVLELVRCEIA